MPRESPRFRGQIKPTLTEKNVKEVLKIATAPLTLHLPVDNSVMNDAKKGEGTASKLSLGLGSDDDDDIIVTFAKANTRSSTKKETKAMKKVEKERENQKKEKKEENQMKAAAETGGVNGGSKENVPVPGGIEAEGRKRKAAADKAEDGDLDRRKRRLDMAREEEEEEDDEEDDDDDMDKDSKSNMKKNLSFNSNSIPTPISNSAQPQIHKLSCHRCGNIRKLLFKCPQCPNIFCNACKAKILSETPDSFDDGCPFCKNLCCCFDKSDRCGKEFHCYKQCPTACASRSKAKEGVKEDDTTILISSSSSSINTPATLLDESTKQTVKAIFEGGDTANSNSNSYMLDGDDAGDAINYDDFLTNNKMPMDSNCDVPSPATASASPASISGFNGCSGGGFGFGHAMFLDTNGSGITTMLSNPNLNPDHPTDLNKHLSRQRIEVGLGEQQGCAEGSRMAIPIASTVVEKRSQIRQANNVLQHEVPAEPLSDNPFNGAKGGGGGEGGEGQVLPLTCLHLDDRHKQASKALDDMDSEFKNVFEDFNLLRGSANGNSNHGGPHEIFSSSGNSLMYFDLNSPGTRDIIQLLSEDNGVPFFFTPQDGDGYGNGISNHNAAYQSFDYQQQGSFSAHRGQISNISSLTSSASFE